MEVNKDASDYEKMEKENGAYGCERKGGTGREGKSEEVQSCSGRSEGTVLSEGLEPTLNGVPHANESYGMERLRCGESLNSSPTEGDYKAPFSIVGVFVRNKKEKKLFE